MFFTDNLKKSNIILNPKSKDRWELIKEMVSLAVKNKELPLENQQSVTKALIEREKSMSTGIGNGVAIPHCSTSKINNLVIIMAIINHEIDFESIDNLPVKIVILLLVPKSKITQHIKTLANIARIMSDDNIREKLLLLKTPATVINSIKKHENNMKK